MYREVLLRLGRDLENPKFPESSKSLDCFCLLVARQDLGDAEELVQPARDSKNLWWPCCCSGVLPSAQLCQLDELVRGCPWCGRKILLLLAALPFGSVLLVQAEELILVGQIARGCPQQEAPRIGRGALPENRT